MTIGYIGVPVSTDPDVLSTAAVNYLMANIPGWTPADGNLEIWHIMALAQMLATSREVASIVPDQIFEYFGFKLHHRRFTFPCYDSQILAADEAF